MLIRLFNTSSKRVALSLGLALTLAACGTTNAPEQTLANTIAPDGFDYATTREVSLNVNALDIYGEPLANTVLDIFHSYDLSAETPDEGVAVLTAATNAQGKFSGTVVLPAHIENVRVRLAAVGISNDVEVPVMPMMSANFGPSEREIEANTTTFDTASLTVQGLGTGYTTLGNWSASSGFPYYLTNGNNYPTPPNKRILELVQNSFPAGKSVNDLHPEFLQNSAESDIVLKDSAEVFVSFLHEGAGFKNTFGYYTYDPKNPPKSRDDIKNYTVIFPNASYNNSGGKLLAGDKVKLKYGPQKLDKFPADTAIGWFILSDGWTKSNTGKLNFPDKPSLEPALFVSKTELNSDAADHMILLKDDESGSFILALEDLKRSSNTSDDDFNDNVYLVDVSPASAVVTDDIPDVATSDDKDEDGVKDAFDDYPNDPLRAFNTYYPSETGHGTLAFEDRWPYLGDYDFNDLVVGYRFNQVLDADNKVKEIKSELVFRAAGAAYANAFAFELPVAAETVESVTGTYFADRKDTKREGAKGSFDYLELNPNGTEAKQQRAVIFVADDVTKLIPNLANTSKTGATAEPATINVDVVFKEAQAQTLFAAPYNPFVLANLNGLEITTQSRSENVRGTEVHLPNHAPTSLASTSLFSTGDDSSEATQGQWYVSKPQNHPWALHIPEDFDYLAEQELISDGYVHFLDWLESGGTAYPDWYQDKPGYRKVPHLY